MMDEGGEVGGAEIPWIEGEHLKLRCEAVGGEAHIRLLFMMETFKNLYKYEQNLKVFK